MREPSESEFLAAYDANADAIFRFCFVQTGDREKAKDIVQETFVRAWKYVAKGRRIDDFRPFLYQTARNIMIDQHRKDRTDSLESMAEGGFDVVDPAIGPATLAEASRAIRAMDGLEPKYREVVTLRYVQELPPREIATIVGESENTVSVRIHRGLEQLKEAMNPEHER